MPDSLSKLSRRHFLLTAGSATAISILALEVSSGTSKAYPSVPSPTPQLTGSTKSMRKRVNYYKKLIEATILPSLLLDHYQILPSIFSISAFCLPMAPRLQIVSQLHFNYQSNVVKSHDANNFTGLQSYFSKAFGRLPTAWKSHTAGLIWFNFFFNDRAF